MTEELLTALRKSAMNYLGRREYSVFELQQKLLSRFDEASDDQVAQVIDRLKDQGLQSDERFADMFVRSRINRGKGPSLIRRELEQQNLSSAITEKALAQNQMDWLEMALRQLQKKYYPKDMAEYAKRAKAMNFLYRRGFDGDIAARALDIFKAQTEEP